MKLEGIMGVAEAGEPGPSASPPTGEERAAAAVMLQMIWGLHISRAVYVVAELGVADMLASGPMTAAQLAQATRAHEPSLYRVLRLLAALGVLTEGEDRSFGLTVLGDRLRADAPASMRSWAMLTDSIGGVRSFDPIIETVRTGKPGLDIAHGMSIFHFLAAHPAQAQGFQAAMSERTAAFAPSLAADFSAARTVADIGGAGWTGTWPGAAGDRSLRRHRGNGVIAPPPGTRRPRLTPCGEGAPVPARSVHP